MINYIWMALIVIAVIFGGISNKMADVTEGAINGAKTSVELAIGLIGIMALWLGIMKVADIMPAKH